MKNKIYCNPINVDYKYQFNHDQRAQAMKICREAADPSMIMYKGKYYIFASMNLSVWVSDDLVNWETHKLPDNLPLYDYAPDVRVINDYVYFSASKRGEVCNFYRTKDVISGPYEKIEGTFDFWDPNLFVDDDERLYFYWGCTNSEPLWGVELDPNTMKPIGEKVALINGDAFSIGYERVGENHSVYPRTEEEVEQAYQYFFSSQGTKEEDIPEAYRPLIRGMLSNKPYIEGAWMDKHNGKYYLQYAAPGTQYNGYADGVYEGDSPLGPFTLAVNNPFSYKPGGFIPGAGHGSTMYDEYGNLWHTSTMRISKNHDFERRVGLWLAGFDEDGELFCNQNYGDWPKEVTEGKLNPWEDPKWYLLSYKKPVTSSNKDDSTNVFSVDENVQTWWKSEKESGWLEIDLERVSTVNVVQINFADDKIDIPVPGKIQGTTQARYIEERQLKTRWILEASVDKENYEVVCDKSEVNTDLPHDLVVFEKPIDVRYLRLKIVEVPYNQKPCISGLRVFGKQEVELPLKPTFSVKRISDLDMEVQIESENAVGYNILWGHKEDKLYHSCMTFDTTQVIGALIKGREYFVRVDAFNEAGIVKGDVIK